MFKSHKPGREQVLMTDRVSNLWRMTSINQSQAGHEGQAVIRSVCLTKLKSFLSSFPRSQLCVASAAPPTVVTSLCSVKGECDSQCGRGRGNGLLLSHDRTPAALWRYNCTVTGRTTDLTQTSFQQVVIVQGSSSVDNHKMYQSSRPGGSEPVSPPSVKHVFFLLFLPLNVEFHCGMMMCKID